MACFTEEWRLVQTYCDRLEADYGIELERTPLIVKGMPAFQKARQPHPLGERFLRSQGQRQR